MPARKSPSIVGFCPASSTRKLASSAGATVFALALCATQCGFPEYDFNPTANAGASAGGAGNGGLSDDAGVPPVTGGGGSLGGGSPGGSAGTGDAGEGGGGPVDPGCTFLEPVTFPGHCFDKKQSEGESAVDCGGGECAPCTGTQACVKNGDCASGKCLAGNVCSQILSLSYMSIVSDAFTRTPKFKITISYLDSISTPLKELRIRYYFNHNGVAEPVIALATQATLDPGGAQMDINAKVRWIVHRFAPGPLDRNGHKTDSYLEITFDSPASLSAGGKLELTQDIVAGSNEVSFEQTSHYSFLNGNGANEAITVYRNAQRLWGIEPPMNLFPTCAFVKGVNLGGGSALTIDSEHIAQEGDENLTFSNGLTYSDPAAKAQPVTDAPTTALLSTAHTFGGSDTASWPVPNGKYLAYAWLTSASGVPNGTLAIQDNPTDKFFGIQTAAGAGWALLGPYPIDIADGALTLSVNGTVHVAGLKLYQVAQ